MVTVVVLTKTVPALFKLSVMFEEDDDDDDDEEDGVDDDIWTDYTNN
jgi:hypothetical protein